jgi:hypothetical protein
MNTRSAANWEVMIEDVIAPACSARHRLGAARKKPAIRRAFCFDVLSTGFDDEFFRYSRLFAGYLGRIGRSRTLVIQRADVLSQFALWALDQFEAHPCPLLEGAEAVHLDGGKMCENVVSSILGFDETETLGIVEPFDSTQRHLENLQLPR